LGREWVICRKRLRREMAAWMREKKVRVRREAVTSWESLVTLLVGPKGSKRVARTVMPQVLIERMMVQREVLVSVVPTC